MVIEPAVAANIVGQLGTVLVTDRALLQPPPVKTLRGIDFYPASHFVRVLVAAAQVFKTANGYVPTLASPSSFNEHIFARKFLAPLPMPSLADKLAVKEFARARLGAAHVPEVVWVGDRPEELFAAPLPAGRFALKSSNGYKQTLFLDLPGDLVTKREEIDRQAASWMQTRFGYDWGEWQYCTFQPKLFLEPFIDFAGERTPDDYKFFCFRGKAVVVEINIDRFTDLRTGFYDRAWTHLPVAYRKPPVACEQPANWDEMIRVAETLAAGFAFARVDLYSDGKSRILFGEITFTPGDACLRLSNFRFDLWLGAHFAKDPQDVPPFALYPPPPPGTR
jgi:TupA-like ATPgrasp